MVVLTVKSFDVGVTRDPAVEKTLTKKPVVVTEP
jgi:hypothetical protein